MTTTPLLKLRYIPQQALKLRTVVQFPAQVVAGAGISLDKTSGIYTFALDFSSLAKSNLVQVQDQQSTYVLGYNSVRKSFSLIQFGALGTVASAPLSFTGAGPLNVAINDIAIAVEQGTPENLVIQLPPVAQKVGPLTIFDVNGVFETNNATVTADAGDGACILGSSTFVMRSNYQSQTFRPYGDKWLVQ